MRNQVTIVMARSAFLFRRWSSKISNRSSMRLPPSIGTCLICQTLIQRIPKLRIVKTVLVSLYLCFSRTICHCKILKNGVTNPRISSSRRTTTTWCLSTTWTLRWLLACSRSNWSISSSKSFTRRLSHSSRISCFSRILRGIWSFKLTFRKTPYCLSSVCLAKSIRTTKPRRSNSSTFATS